MCGPWNEPIIQDALICATSFFKNIHFADLRLETRLLHRIAPNRTHLWSKCADDKVHSGIDSGDATTSCESLSPPERKEWQGERCRHQHRWQSLDRSDGLTRAVDATPMKVSKIMGPSDSLLPLGTKNFLDTRLHPFAKKCKFGLGPYFSRSSQGNAMGTNIMNEEKRLICRMCFKNIPKSQRVHKHFCSIECRSKLKTHTSSDVCSSYDYGKVEFKDGTKHYKKVCKICRRGNFVSPYDVPFEFL